MKRIQNADLNRMFPVSKSGRYRMRIRDATTGSVVEPTREVMEDFGYRHDPDLDAPTPKKMLEPKRQMGRMWGVCGACGARVGPSYSIKGVNEMARADGWLVDASDAPLLQGDESCRTRLTCPRCRAGKATLGSLSVPPAGA